MNHNKAFASKISSDHVDTNEEQKLLSLVAVNPHHTDGNDNNNTDSDALVICAVDGPSTEMVDLEYGRQSTSSAQETLKRRKPPPSVREQSRRFSRLLISQTELHQLQSSSDNEETNDDGDGIFYPQQTQQQFERRSSLKNESSGFRYWLQEAQRASEHGGDYALRLDAASRAALGTLIVFSALILTRQRILEGAWIGNIFMLVNVQDSWGASLRSAQSFASGILLTTLVAALPTATVLKSSLLTDTQAKWVLPLVVAGWSFVTMSCPQLASRNIMLLVLYMIVATAVRSGEQEWWEPLSWTTTYFVGMATAVVVHLVPLPRLNLATTKVHQLFETLELDFAMLLRQSKQYADHASAFYPTEARAAVASVELLYSRITASIQQLKGHLPAAQTELHWTGRSAAANDVKDWVEHIENMVATPLKSLVAALGQRVLGEEQHVTSAAVRQAKGILAQQSAPSRDRVLDAMISTVAICMAKADPCERRVILPDVQEELEEALQEHKAQFNQAIQQAAWALHQQTIRASQEGRDSGRANMAFAHLTRRKTALCAITDLCESLLEFLGRHHWESSSSHFGQVVPARDASSLSAKWHALGPFLQQQWLWHNPDDFRLALKTSVGMFLGSLFVAVDYLWDLVAPFGLWVGITIASVNLSTTGSSFAKASDRLYGTLLAAAYAMLVTFPNSNREPSDFWLVPSIAVFTWILYFLKTKEHAYRYVYAAASIGSMLYGSLHNDFHVAAYIPLRIELIFTGICIFTLVEVLLFHRSSRRRVESLSLDFFPAVRDFAKQATICAQRMQTYCQEQPQTDQEQPQQHGQRSNDDMIVEDDDPFQLQKLEECRVALQSLGDKLQAELPSGLEEPHVGFSLDLDARSYGGLSEAVQDCGNQARLVIRSLTKLAGMYHQPEHPLRRTVWPRLHTEFLGQVFRVTELASRKLSQAYPDGRLRPQAGNAVQAALAASTLRELHDVRLLLVAQWSEVFAKAMEEQGHTGVDPVSIMNTSITTTRILDLCRHLQMAGKHVEAIAHNFPASSSKPPPT